MNAMKRIAMPALAALVLAGCGGGGGVQAPAAAASPERVWSPGGPSCDSVGCVNELHYERIRELDGMRCRWRPSEPSSAGIGAVPLLCRAPWPG